jgi:hypothetical protein
MADANERMAPFGDDAHKNGDGEIAPVIPGGPEEERRHGEVEDARDLDLADVQRGPRRSDAEEPARKSKTSDADAEVYDAGETEEHAKEHSGFLLG